MNNINNIIKKKLDYCVSVLFVCLVLCLRLCVCMHGEGK